MVTPLVVKDTPSKNVGQTSTKPRQNLWKPLRACLPVGRVVVGSVVMRAGDRASRKMHMLTVVAVCDGVTTARSWEGCARKGLFAQGLACEKTLGEGRYFGV